MTERLQLALAGVLAILALALGGVLFLGGDDDPTSGPDGFTVSPSTGFAGSVSPPGLPVRDFALRDQDGTPTSLRPGRITVLTFLYATCKDTCPITATQIQSGLDKLPGDGEDVDTLAISVDPAQDTPTLARKFLLARGMTGRMKYLLGSRDELKPVWGRYFVQPQGTPEQTAVDPERFDHTAQVFVLDRTGRQRVSFPVAQLNPSALAHDVRKLMDER